MDARSHVHSRIKACPSILTVETRQKRAHPLYTHARAHTRPHARIGLQARARVSQQRNKQACVSLLLLLLPVLLLPAALER